MNVRHHNIARSLSIITLSFAIFCYPARASETTIVTEASYVMGDGDTLAIAEERVLQRAQRRAVEEAGLYIESTFRDMERSEAGTSIQTSSLEVRTIAAAITRTEILETRRSFLKGLLKKACAACGGRTMAQTISPKVFEERLHVRHSP